jgi:hypothetical protein
MWAKRIVLLYLFIYMPIQWQMAFKTKRVKKSLCDKPFLCNFFALAGKGGKGCKVILFFEKVTFTLI